MPQICRLHFLGFTKEKRLPKPLKRTRAETQHCKESAKFELISAVKVVVLLKSYFLYHSVGNLDHFHFGACTSLWLCKSETLTAPQSP